MTNLVKIGDATLHLGDCLAVMRDMPTDSVDMTITSPPYTDQRTYGIGFKLSGQGWVDWCAERIVEMCRVTAGIVFFNAAGPVRDFQYQPVVEWLIADLTRKHGIVCGPAPYVFHRVGIPGSGGPHYHRRDWEPVYCFAKPESLPPRWSDNTATGHPPKWAPGGEMSHRLSDGTRRNEWGRNETSSDRKKDGSMVKEGLSGGPLASKKGVNQWGHSIETGATVTDSGGVVRSRGKRPSHVVVDGRDQWGGTPHNSSGEGRQKNGKHKGKVISGHATTRGHDADGNLIQGDYSPPVLANSGNKIMGTYSASDVERLVGEAHDVLQLKVGGGMMGSDIAHESEAPFPETLARFFVVSYCPPGGTVLDPFCGSGTSLSVAIQENRKAVGIDIRGGKGGLATAQKRLETVTPATLFHETTP